MSRNRPRIGHLLTVVVALFAVGCALPTDESARVVKGPEVEDAMNPTTSTTQAVGSTQDRELFFFDEEDLLVAELRATPTGDDVATVLTMLREPSEDSVRRTSVPEQFSVTETSLDEGTLTVVLADDTLFTLGGTELGRAVAQVVVTATQLEDHDVERVQFVLDGEVREVPAGPDGTNTDEPVDECDFRQFLPRERCDNIPEPTTTTETRPPGS